MSKYSESLGANKSDLSSLKSELRAAIAQQSENQQDLNNFRKRNDELNAQNKVMQDSVERLRQDLSDQEDRNLKLKELHQITKSDCKHAKEQLEAKIEELGTKDREIR